MGSDAIAQLKITESIMTGIASAIEQVLPGLGFVLVVFEFNAPGMATMYLMLAGKIQSNPCGNLPPGWRAGRLSPREVMMGDNDVRDVRMRVVIFHDDADGRCAAALAGRNASGAERVEYIPVMHGSSPPDLRVLDYDRKRDDVWLVDFSFKLDEMKALVEAAGDIGHFWWFDHHITDIEDLDELTHLPGIRANGVAACMLVWRFLQPGVFAPWPVEYIADYDLFKFNHGDESRWFYEAFLAEPYTRPRSVLWDIYFDVFVVNEPRLQDYLAKGEILRKAHMTRLKEEVERLGMPFLMISHNGATAQRYRGLRINCLGNGDHGDVVRAMGFDLAWCYVRMEIDGRWVWKHSLYSNIMDVAAFCRELGGGGHRNAAGFEEATRTCRHADLEEVHFRIKATK